MKWQLLLVCLALGALLVGCDSADRPQTVQDSEPLPPTEKAAIDNADDALATLEKAVAGSDIEAVRTAVVAMNKALGGLMSHLSQKDLEIQAKAREGGATQMPPSVADPLAPALQAAMDALDAMVPPPKNDVAKVREAIPIIKSGLDAARDAAE